MQSGGSGLWITWKTVNTSAFWSAISQKWGDALPVVFARAAHDQARCIAMCSSRTFGIAPETARGGGEASHSIRVLSYAPRMLVRSKPGHCIRCGDAVKM